jgi:hypothetical protein
MDFESREYKIGKHTPGRCRKILIVAYNMDDLGSVTERDVRNVLTDNSNPTKTRRFINTSFLSNFTIHR